MLTDDWLFFVLLFILLDYYYFFKMVISALSDDRLNKVKLLSQKSYSNQAICIK